MDSQGNQEQNTPAVKKKRKATKRKILKPQDDFQTSNVYAVENISRQFRLTAQNLAVDSDEEENIEEFQAKITSRANKSSNLTNHPKRKLKQIVISDDEEESLTKTPIVNVEQLEVLGSCPSPPPPPEYYHEVKPSRTTQKSIRNLDALLHSSQYAQRCMEDSPFTPSIDVESPVTDTMTVRIRLHQQINKFQMKMDEPYAKIFFEMAERESVDIRRIKLTRNVEDIFETDTPRSSSLRVGEIIDCTIVKTVNLLTEDVTDLASDEDKVTIKFQGQEKNTVFEETLLKIFNFHTAMKNYSDFRKISLEKLRFYFDGECISGEETPESLDMEEEATVDVKVV